MSVLIIEDDRPFTELICAALEPRSVRFATTYAEALRLMSETPPQVVLLDLALPDSTPAQTIKRIAEIKKVSNNPTVIVITGNPDIYRLHNAAVREGADHVLSKDNGFFEALEITIVNAGKKQQCTAQATVEQIERVVATLVRPPP